MGENINTPGNEVFPFVHDDGTLYFASNGHPSIGGYDIFTAEQNGLKFKKAENLGLNQTLLERLSDKVKHSYLLDTQYRMNDKILSFSNKMFYDNKLKSAIGIKTWTLNDDQSPLVLIDTSGCGFDENFNKKNRSRYNEGEFFILREHFLQNKDKYENVSIGIISPYSEQIKYLKSKK